MKMMMTTTIKTYDYIVIGAGSAGLSFSALMERKGFSVALIEAHSLPGGCSSYFERDGYIFDAGATTLSGLKSNRPIAKLIKDLDLKIELTAIDPGIVSIIKNKVIHRYKNPMKWNEELTRVFPKIQHEKFWKKISEIEHSGWNLTQDFKNIPLRSFSTLPSFFNSKFFSAIKSLPNLFKSVGAELNDLAINDPDYLAMIKEMLFITAQNNELNDTPLLMGAMGLAYPEDTFYATGGMKAFATALASKCSNIFYRNEVKQILPLNNGRDGFQVLTNKQMLQGKKLISTIPIWNHEILFDDKKVKSFFQKYPAPLHDECWSAFMIYLTVTVDYNRDSLYYQIHTDAIPHCGTHSFFVSLSHPKDEVRSINGRQVVTISTHTRSKEWLKLDRVDYENKKDETSEFILNYLKKAFNITDSDLQNVMTGTPKTFIKYTHRNSGLVGGIPHSLKRSPLDFLIAKSPLENFYMLGDTQFPGQGIAAVILGAQNLENYLTN